MAVAAGAKLIAKASQHQKRIQLRMLEVHAVDGAGVGCAVRKIGQIAQKPGLDLSGVHACWIRHPSPHFPYTFGVNVQVGDAVPPTTQRSRPVPPSDSLYARPGPMEVLTVLLATESTALCQRG